MKTQRLFFGFCVALLAWFGDSPTEAADLYATAPSPAQDSVLMDARPGEYYYNLAADAVRHKDYAHAVAMYEVSASWGYKTSQYNLGVMYARGEGVPVDLPRAMAWMSLAAEREDKQYVQARDLVAANLDKNGLAQAEGILHTLMLTYADTAAMPRAKARWRETRDGATGSHLGFTGNVTVAGGDGNGAVGKPQGGPIEQYLMTKFEQGGREHGKRQAPIGQANSGAQGAADLIGTSGVDGATVYADLRMTDNPYDPRLSRGIATVGALIPVGEKKALPDNAKAIQAPGGDQQKQ